MRYHARCLKAPECVGADLIDGGHNRQILGFEFLEVIFDLLQFLRQIAEVCLQLRYGFREGEVFHISRELEFGYSA